MGFFDQILNQQDEPDPRFSDYATAMIPFAGPFMARDRMKKRASKDYYDKADTIYKYVDDDPLSQRVASRMLTRTGEETLPGIQAATEATRQAQDPANMGNFGNVLMNTSTALQGRGVPGAVNLAAAGHKAFQTPWKPEEGQRKPMNFTKGNQTKSTYSPEEAKQLVSAGWKFTGVAEQQQNWTPALGSEIGFKGSAAKDDYMVVKDDEGNITDFRKADNAPNISVGGASINTPADLSQSILSFGNSVKATKQLTRVTGQLRDVISRNPTGGVQGWSGVITGVVGKVLNVTDFMAGLGAEEKAIVDKYSGKWASKASQFFPTEDQAMAESLMIQLGYSVARMNNMGTSGGGRGITDTDAERADMQLAKMSRPADMLPVLDRIEADSIDTFNDDYSVLEAIMQSNGKEIPGPIKDLREGIVTKRPSAKPKTQQEREAEAEVRKNPALRQQFIEYFGYDPLAQ